MNACCVLPKERYANNCRNATHTAGLLKITAVRACFQGYAVANGLLHLIEATVMRYPRLLQLAVLAIILTLSPTARAQSAGDQFWHTEFGANFSMDGQIYAVEVTPTSIYIGGSFLHVAGISAKHVARFDRVSATWSALDSGTDGEVHALKAFNVAGEELLYAGGHFTKAGEDSAVGIAIFDGSHWNPMGSGIQPTEFGVYSIVLDKNGNPYAAGGFNTVTAAGDTLLNIAHWNGSAWKPLAGGVTNWRGALPVFSMVVSGDTLYVGGYFDYVGSHISAKGVARWLNDAWSSVGPVGDAPVHVDALTEFHGVLYAAGDFTRIGNDSAYLLARYYDNAWHALPDSTPFMIGSFAVSGDRLYAGHIDLGPPGTYAKGVASFDGKHWSALGDGMRSGVAALAPYGTTGVLAAGYFDSVATNRRRGWPGGKLRQA